VGVLKPNIVFFGEDLGDAFHTQMSEDHGKVDLLVVVGSSLQVRPVSTVPYNIAPEVPQILINREVLPKYHADIKLLGNCDQILALLALAIGGEMRAKMAKGEKPILAK
jgi:NAD+-dependent protein deacetylase sirtuin 1